MKDVFDNDRQSFYTFATLKEKYNLPSSDFLKYLTILNSIPNAWKRLLKFEDKNIPPDKKFIQMVQTGTLTNSNVYKILLQNKDKSIVKSEQKWNDIF